jgi:RNA polymerase sigma factor (sigma-70 family)
VEASTLPAPASVARHSIPASLMRLRSDDQLVASFRAGSDEAFRTIHDRYRPRLFVYTRHMLAGSRHDAEDALQDVFVRAFTALRADGRPVALRPWLYRIAHNRCIDQLRRPGPVPTELIDLDYSSLDDPLLETQQRDDLRQLVRDIEALPGQQRSALLMRELQGMSYADLAVALGVSLPAIKSLLLRARTALIEAAIARDSSCEEIRSDLVFAHDHGVRASAKSRRHTRDCEACADYRQGLRSMRRSFTALMPAAPLGGFGVVAKLFGGSGAAAGGAGATTSLATGGAVLGGGAATVTAGKVAALVCCAALVTGGALRATQPAGHPQHPRHGGGHAATARVAAPAGEQTQQSLTAIAARAGGAPFVPEAGASHASRSRHAQPRRTDSFVTGQDAQPYAADVKLPPADTVTTPKPDTPATPAPSGDSAGAKQNPLASLLAGQTASSGQGSGAPSGSGSSSGADTGGSSPGPGSGPSPSGPGSGSPPGGASGTSNPPPPSGSASR